MQIRSRYLLSLLAAVLFVGCGAETQAPVPADTELSGSAVGVPQASGFDADWIGPGGGSLSISGSALTIPSGALTTQTYISMEGQSDGSVELLPHGLLFSQAVSLYFIVPMGGGPTTQVVEWFDPGKSTWIEIPSQVDPLGRVAPLQHFSLYRIQSTR